MENKLKGKKTMKKMKAALYEFLGNGFSLFLRERKPFTQKPIKRPYIGPWTTQEGRNTHLSKVSYFFIEILSFSKVPETIGFFLIQILIFRMLRNNDDVRRCSYFELGLPVLP